MSIQDVVKRVFVIVTVLLCLGLAILFGAIQSGMI